MSNQCVTNLLNQLRPIVCQNQANVRLLRAEIGGLGDGATGPTGPVGPTGPASINLILGTTGIVFQGGTNTVTITYGGPLANPVVLYSLECPGAIGPVGIQSVMSDVTNTTFDLTTTVSGMGITIDQTAAGFLFADEALVGGNPAVTYVTGDSANLLFARANDVDGDTWTTTTVLTVPMAGDSFSSFNTKMAVIGGNPAIVYILNESGSNNLYYIRATNATGTAWPASGTLVAAGLVFTAGLAGLIATSDRPAIGYLDAGQLLFRRADDATGAAWTNPALVLDAAPTTFSILSNNLWLDLISSNPAIVYSKQTMGGASISDVTIRYLRSSATTGATGTWPAVVPGDYTSPTAVSAINARVSTNAEVVSGNPGLVFTGASGAANGVIHFVRATEATGNTLPWAAAIPITTDILDRSQQTYGGLIIANGNPAFNYSTSLFSLDNTRYVRATAADGSTWPATSTSVLQNEAMGRIGLLANVNGNPAIPYTEISTAPETVNFIRSSDSNGDVWEPSISCNVNYAVGEP